MNTRTMAIAAFTTFLYVLLIVSESGGRCEVI